MHRKTIDSQVYKLVDCSDRFGPAVVGIFKEDEFLGMIYSDDNIHYFLNVGLKPPVYSFEDAIKKLVSNVEKN